MREHAQSCVAGGFELIERRIGMPRRYCHAVFREPTGRLRFWVGFRRQRKYPQQSATGIMQTPRDINARRHHSIRRMRAAITSRFADEWSFDMNPDNDLRRQGIALAQFDQPLQSGDHQIKLFSDDRREDRARAIALQRIARSMQRLGRKSVAVEINTAVTVHLKIEIFARHPTPATRQSPHSNHHA